MKQKTIAKETTLKGVGLHTGKEVSLTFKPAEANTGFVFCREDLDGSPSIQALAQHVTRTERSTILSDGSIEIHTSEHVLAALTGMDLDNVLICLDSEEPPIMDGSSIHFVNAIEEAGIVEQDAEQEVFEVTEIIEYKDETTGSELILLPHDSYEINVNHLLCSCYLPLVYENWYGFKATQLLLRMLCVNLVLVLLRLVMSNRSILPT